MLAQATQVRMFRHLWQVYATLGGDPTKQALL
jgi:hypothetical protein